MNSQHLKFVRQELLIDYWLILLWLQVKAVKYTGKTYSSPRTPIYAQEEAANSLVCISSSDVGIVSDFRSICWLPQVVDDKESKYN